MYPHYIRSYQKQFYSFEECWDRDGFWPKRAKHATETELIISAVATSKSYFDKNYLWGLLTSDYGSMFPEFSKGCGLLLCPKTQQALDQVIRLMGFSDGFERDLKLRQKRIEDLDDLDWEDIAEKVDVIADSERLESKLYNCCEYIVLAKKIDIHYTDEDNLEYLDRRITDPDWQRHWRRLSEPG